MKMKELFEKCFEVNPPEAFYICGGIYSVFVISKHKGDEFYMLSVLDVECKKTISLKAGSFDELMNIVNLLTYSSDKVYYERLAE